MRKLGLLTLALAVITSSAQVWGHPGHGVTPAEPSGLLHCFIEPVHLLPWIALAVAVYMVYRLTRSVVEADRA